MFISRNPQKGHSASLYRRATSLTYPNGRVLTFSYGDAGSIEDRASRIVSLVDEDDTHLVDYDYLGRGTFVIADDTELDLQWTLASLTGSNDPDTGDIYTGLDRFGRVKDNRWYDYGSSVDVDRIQYGYDRAGNRLWRHNVVASALSAEFDELYAYDGIRRLKDMARGTLNTPRTALTSETFAQCWTLDSTGNWQGFREDDNGDGTWDLIQARTANPVNEITNISETAGPSWITPVYSAVGNMTTLPQPADPTQSYTATYDAWHRLVKVAEGSDTVSEYAYDGVRRRIIQKSYTSGTLSETRHLYYTQPSQWQVLEERLGTSTDAERQFVWGLRYIDDCVLRDRDTNADGTLDQRLYACQDANWNATALVDVVGDVQERDAYSAYGVPLFLTPTFGSRAASSFDWETLYCGYRYETATGLFHVRWRWLLSQLASWISRDSQIHPAPGDSSLYEYAGSSPLTYVDLDGRQLQQAQAQKTCKFRVCATAIPGVPIAKHLLTIVDGIAYRCGPSGKGKETDNCGCEPFGDYGQLVCTSGKYEEGFVDWVEPAQENCEEFEVPNADCDTIGKCFGNVLKAVESCCVNYVPAPADASKGCNSNCAVNWMLSACFEKAPKVIFGQKPGIAPGFQVKPPDCIKESAKK